MPYVLTPFFSCHMLLPSFAFGLIFLHNPPWIYLSKSLAAGLVLIHGIDQRIAYRIALCMEELRKTVKLRYMTEERC